MRDPKSQARQNRNNPDPSIRDSQELLDKFHQKKAKNVHDAKE